MPIEFACERCTRLLRVPDGSQGQACECPACRTVLVIPGHETTRRESTRHEATRTPKPSSNRMRQLMIPCPKCRFELRSQAGLVGTKGQCRNCNTIFTITEDPAAAAASIVDSEFVFNCPRCAQLFAGQAEMEGRKGKCHACGHVFAIELKPVEQWQVPVPPGQRSPSRNSNANSQTTSTPQGQQPANIQFACNQCRGMMEVPGSTKGQMTQCPYCQAIQTIP